MRVLITGTDGQVAQSLAERADRAFEAIFVSRPGLDLAIPATIEQTVTDIAPDLIVSAAAYTAVDQAEDEPELAMAVNGEGPAVLARAAQRIGAPIIHLSTDYVFDGHLDRPYSEDDQVAPIGAYGRSKLAGEDAVRSATPDHIILRTAWVYSPFGQNFVKTMLRLGATRDTLSVVDDQIGNPTSALDIAEAVIAVVSKLQSEPGRHAGTYHFAGTGHTSWAGFAKAIFEASSRRGGPSAEVQGIPGSDWPTKAARPSNSRLDSSKFHQVFGYLAPSWKTSLDEVIDRLVT